MKPQYYTIAAVVIAAATIVYLVNRLQAKDKLIHQHESVINEKNAIITYKTNKEGKIIAEKDAAVLRANDFAQAYPKLAETLEKSFDVKVKNLKAYMQNAFVAYGQGNGTVNNHYHYDSLTNKTVLDSSAFSMDDKFLKFDVTYHLKDSKFSQYRYTYTDTVTIVLSSGKKWWQVFKSDKIIAATSFGNKTSKSVSMTNVLVDNTKDKRFSFGVSVGYGVVKVGDGIHTGWFAGPSVTYSLFKF